MVDKRKEPSVQGDSSMSEQSLYCLGIHFKFLYEQGINKKPFNPAEPCINCKYGVNGSRECNLSVDWSKMITQLAKTTGIHINYFVSDNAMEDKNLYCLNMHVNVIFPAVIRDEKPNLAQPCRNCKYAELCDFDWHTYIHNAFKRFGLSYNCPMG